MASDLDKIHREIRGLEKALALKSFKGSVIMELVRCGKLGCSACPHGPYAYLHYWDSAAQKSRRKYLGRKGLEHYASPKTEIDQRIRDLRQLESKVLGEAQTRETGGSNCRRCRHLSTLDKRPFCGILQSFLALEMSSQVNDCFEEKKEVIG